MKPSEDMEKLHIEVNKSVMSFEEENDEKFQVLINQEENVAWSSETHGKHVRNHVDDDAKARNIKTGREEWRLDEELVDCCEMQGSMQESTEEMMKNDEENERLQCHANLQ